MYLGELLSPRPITGALPGVRGTTLIDDTYNSSPRAAELALDTLAALAPGPQGRRYAVLGDMLELGALTDALHRRVGRHAAVSGIDVPYRGRR